MRDASPALKSFLTTRQPCEVADLFTLTLLNGLIFRYTSYDQPLTVYGNVFTSGNGNPLIQRTKWNMVNTIEVPEMEVKLLALNTDTINGQLVKQMIHNGGFDGARMQLERVFMPTPGDTSLGTVIMFTGRMSKITLSAGGAQLTVRGDNVIFNQYMPRNQYQTGCVHTVYDVGCKLLASSFTGTQTVAAGSTNSNILCGTLAFGTIGNYILGTIAFTSGAAAGAVRTIFGATVNAGINNFGLAYPLYATPSIGDTFTVTYGCIKTQAYCTATMNNLANYRGFPYVPDASIAY